MRHRNTLATHLHTVHALHALSTSSTRCSDVRRRPVVSTWKSWGPCGAGGRGIRVVVRIASGAFSMLACGISHAPPDAAVLVVPLSLVYVRQDRCGEEQGLSGGRTRPRPPQRRAASACSDFAPTVHHTAA